jgi:hypothetical protein
MQNGLTRISMTKSISKSNFTAQQEMARQDFSWFSSSEGLPLPPVFNRAGEETTLKVATSVGSGLYWENLGDTELADRNRVRNYLAIVMVSNTKGGWKIDQTTAETKKAPVKGTKAALKEGKARA